jgi:hypothetical protein
MEKSDETWDCYSLAQDPDDCDMVLISLECSDDNKKFKTINIKIFRDLINVSMIQFDGSWVDFSVDRWNNDECAYNLTYYDSNSVLLNCSDDFIKFIDETRKSEQYTKFYEAFDMASGGKPYEKLLNKEI